jgi:hypothetical protein
MPKPSPVVSLSSELHLVARAIDGTRVLTEKWRDGHFNAEELPRLAHALHATLVLVRERLTLLDCAVRDTLDPRHLFHPENQAFDEQPGDDGDVVLRSWSAKKAAAKLKQEAERAARHVEALVQRRRRSEQGE